MLMQEEEAPPVVHQLALDLPWTVVDLIQQLQQQDDDHFMVIGGLASNGSSMQLELHRQTEEADTRLLVNLKTLEATEQLVDCLEDQLSTKVKDFVGNAYMYPRQTAEEETQTLVEPEPEPEPELEPEAELVQPQDTVATFSMPSPDDEGHQNIVVVNPIDGFPANSIKQEMGAEDSTTVTIAIPSVAMGANGVGLTEVKSDDCEYSVMEVMFTSAEEQIKAKGFEGATSSIIMQDMVSSDDTVSKFLLSDLAAAVEAVEQQTEPPGIDPVEEFDTVLGNSNINSTVSPHMTRQSTSKCRATQKIQYHSATTSGPLVKLTQPLKNLNDLEYLKIEVRLWQCHICERLFAKPEVLQEHMERKHDLLVQTLGEMIHDIKTVYACYLCGFVTENKFIMAQHVRRVHKVYLATPWKAAYPCILCDKKLVSYRYLHRHLKKKHWGDPRYKEALKAGQEQSFKAQEPVTRPCQQVMCPVCDKLFLSLHISRHLKVVHSEVDNLPELIAVVKKALQAGREKKRTELPKQTCPECGREIMYKNMKRHVAHCRSLAKYRATGKKKAKKRLPRTMTSCPRCKQSMLVKNIVRHMKVCTKHSEEQLLGRQERREKLRKVPCAFCGEIMLMKNVNRHLKACKSAPEGASVLVHMKHESDPDAPRSLCSRCGRVLLKKNMKVHLKRCIKRQVSEVVIKVEPQDDS